MQVIIDGKESTAQTEDYKELGLLLRALRTQIDNQKRTILTLKLDGKVLTDLKEEEFSSWRLDKFSLLEIQTIDPYELSLSTLKELKIHLGRLEEFHTTISSDISKGDIAKAISKLASCMDGWQALLSAIRSIAILTGIKLNELYVDKESTFVKLEKLISDLDNLRAAVDKMDFLNISDILEYNLKPEISGWYSLLDSLIKILEEKAIQPQ
jgi:hypothetical protein